MDFEIKNRASRPSERGVVFVDSTGEERISKAVNVLLDVLVEVDNENARNGLLTALLAQIDNVSVKGRGNSQGNDSKIDVSTEENMVRIDDDRVEINDDSYHIKIDKDEKIKAKKGGDFRDKVDNGYYSTGTSTATTSTKIKLEVEADVYTDITEVRVELNGTKSNFVTIAKTKDTVVQEVAVLYMAEESLVLEVLDFEIKEGSSLGDDPQNIDDEYSDDDEEEVDSDRREDKKDGEGGRGNDKGEDEEDESDD